MFKLRKAIKPERHTNPDGSVGGFVSPKARVHESAHVASTAQVFSGAVLGENDRLERGDIATPQGIVRSDEFTLEN